MKLVFTDSAKKELEDLPQELAALFILHLEKMQDMPPRKHMKYGIPYHTEKVTKQARIIYDIREDKIYIIHCFGSHKEYERWYKSYK
ncbi:MAG: type II toxin-antitoxin system RelE family toxin [Methanothrix sp.]